MLWNHGPNQAGGQLGGTALRALEPLGYFDAQGGAIPVLAGLALGRLPVVPALDTTLADRRFARHCEE
jgi:hypothetical protein